MFLLCIVVVCDALKMEGLRWRRERDERADNVRERKVGEIRMVRRDIGA
jgi:hypothetical protein